MGTAMKIIWTLSVEDANYILAALGDRPFKEVAALIAMLDVVVGPLLVLAFFGEMPDSTTLIGGAFVLAAAVWRLAPELRRQSGAVTPAGSPL